MSSPLRSLVPLFAIALLTAGCGKPSLPEGCRPLVELKAAGLCPLEVTSTAATIGVVQKLWVTTIRNVSDVPVTAFKATAVLAVGEGGAIRHVQQELGHAGLETLEPGESGDLKFAPSEPEARVVKVVIREVVYEGPNPIGGTLSFRFKNPKHDTDVQAVMAKP